MLKVSLVWTDETGAPQVETIELSQDLETRVTQLEELFSSILILTEQGIEWKIVRG